jgi:hypothetical protein
MATLATINAAIQKIRLRGIPKPFATVQIQNILILNPNLCYTILSLPFMSQIVTAERDTSTAPMGDIKANRHRMLTAVD